MLWFIITYSFKYSNIKMGKSDDSSVVMDNEEESSKDYRPGGYHPVHIGELFLNRYIVVQKLGWGHFSTVWLCKDTKYGTYVAMKVQRSAPNYTEAAYDEIDLLIKIAQGYKDPRWIESIMKYVAGTAEAEEIKEEGMKTDHCFVVQLLNTFLHTGPNGSHVCMCFEILGVNLLEIIKHYKYAGVPVHIVRSIGRQVLIGLDYLHRICGIIHTDLKPENVLVQLSQAQVKEILTRGLLLNKNLQGTPPKELPQSILYPEIGNNVDEDEFKRIQKAEKRKRYRQRKKEAEKKKKAAENPKEKQAGQNENLKSQDQKKKAENQETALPSPDNISTQTSEKPKKRKRKRNKNKKAEPVEEEISEIQEADLLKSLQSPDVDYDETIRIKIADLGNACWVNRHFATEIQTRQYRSPEVILGIDYNATADVWSFACMLFELLTGDFLFEPRSGKDTDKNEDHLAQMIETLGLMPKHWSLSGRDSKKFLNKYGRLRHIDRLNIWLLRDVLIDKYRFKVEEAEQLADFMRPMLIYQPEKRATAQECLKHPWIWRTDKDDIKMTEEAYEEYMKKAEDHRLQKLERLERGEAVSSPELPADLTAESADLEDNDYWSDEASLEIDSDEAPLIDEEAYHLKLINARAKLGL
ncbi:unnamed protein product [Blepharisma stoltei]|uniref:non-specific serine/threonine protein kinase n=1 Tax=Blepharisma stoltei TaxID=1481888 RepID=A0AAU9IKJ9_9CILI|nr:unnamed protein product [Blepharisma stoltei]